MGWWAALKKGVVRWKSEWAEPVVAVTRWRSRFIL